MTRRATLRSHLTAKLVQYEKTRGTLAGISSDTARSAFVEQLVDSVRRIEYVVSLTMRDISPARADAHSHLFDPLKAAVYLNEMGEFENACWLAFLAIHCGHHRLDGWRLVRAIYGGDGGGHDWDWIRVSGDVAAFRDWLESKRRVWQSSGAAGRFGGHRRYESLSGVSTNGTGAVVESYVSWVAATGTHRTLVDQALASSGGSQTGAFDLLYRKMAAVRRLGRLGRFDFLCMLSKLGLAKIAPGSPYLAGSSGPLKGARLMAGSKSVADLDVQMADLGAVLGVNGQVIEDALCNWQKNPSKYLAFRG